MSLLLPLCLLIPPPPHQHPSMQRTELVSRRPDKDEMPMQQPRAESQKGNRHIQPATLRQFPDRPYPSLFFARKKTAQATPHATFREYAPSPQHPS